MPKICFVPGCRTGYLKDRMEKKANGEAVNSLFKPPKDPDLFEEWKRAIPNVKRDLKETDSVCALHFRKGDVLVNYEVKITDGTIWKQKRDQPGLKKNAVPCIFPSVVDYISENIVLKRKPSTRRSFPKKPSTRRSLPKKPKIPVDVSTSINDESEGSEEVLLSPKEIESFTANLLSYQPSAIDKCSVLQSEFNTSIETEFPSESPVQIPQSKLFRDKLPVTSRVISPQNNDKENLSMRSQINSVDALAQAAQVIYSQENSGGAQEIITDPCREDNAADEPEMIFPQSVLNEQFSFQFIKANINMIDTQNSMWKVLVFDTFIIFTRWNIDCDLVRKIVIKDDLTVKVYLKERLSTIGKELKILSLETISKLIKRVEKTTICPEIYNNEGKCHGFLQGTFICWKRNLCEGCIKWEKEKALQEKRRLLEQKKIAQNQVELIRFHFNV